ncbi:hypothetical protein Pedsa_2746 [Pseudopedobacter saltans DSM 12145]|uniref:Uncharacterized protein n=1 Tax=Pseudopedobacter saltans (strain ATCC 51119 / DSM 12145 / JCM 21818 / CCUG 39354 / LMG 10337 / NBRC 100064 / NCIMB 13643) TaxID=762903 RepID=F0S724_PSESL|nr:hypothetical protein [Pseudopedobacter saltans]ADY53287.1 hypothetical protein Pedsa_2746 [Pseudopedobacter saltans DSM 12145]
MAKVKRNVIMQGMSGKICDQLVLKTYNYGTVVSKIPDMSKVVPSSHQKDKRNRFKEAVAYAKAIIADVHKKAGVAYRTPKGKLVYHQAIREYLTNY